jgi:catechol 2,3-dioxygenase-like lactoylglutathione lyase family enzyme
MKFASVRLVTLDVERLSAFYSKLCGVAAVHLAEGFAEIRLPGATPAARQPLVVRLAQASHQLALELAHGLGIDAVVVSCDTRYGWPLG